MTTGTMLLSIAVYAMFYGWRFAAGFVLLLFVHEAGHYAAARKRGLDVSAARTSATTGYRHRRS